MCHWQASESEYEKLLIKTLPISNSLDEKVVEVLMFPTHSTLQDTYTLVLHLALTLGLKVFGWHALSLRRACSSALCHALRKASERATPKLKRAEALVWFCGLLLSASNSMAEYPLDERPYTAKGYAWENNTLGMDERVPAPWAPLRYEGDQRRVLGATIYLWQWRYANSDFEPKT